MGVRILMLVSMLGLWFVASPTTTFACSCADPGTPAEALAQSELVFRGTVTWIDREDDERWVAVQFNVETVWKGSGAEAITLTTPADTAACGYPFEEGVEYVVYSWNGDDVGRCSRTAPVAFAGEDFAVLASGAPTGGVTGFPTTGRGGLAVEDCPRDGLLGPIVAAASGAFLLGLIVLRMYVRLPDRADAAATVDRT